MSDSKYCYPNTNILKNKLQIRDAEKLYHAETELTYLRLKELEGHPIKGKFDFNHLKAIHKYIFQDIYDWAGKERTVEISKGNSWFCTLVCLNSYASSVFSNYYPQCKAASYDKNAFVEALAANYGDLNALHPFREGNGRTQREFARCLCLDCGYIFDLSGTSHRQMLNASIMSMDHGDNSKLMEIFANSVIPIDQYQPSKENNALNILSSDDLTLPRERESDNQYEDNKQLENHYTTYYLERIQKMQDDTKQQNRRTRDDDDLER